MSAGYPEADVVHAKSLYDLASSIFIQLYCHLLFLLVFVQYFADFAFVAAVEDHDFGFVKVSRWWQYRLKIRFSNI